MEKCRPEKCQPPPPGDSPWLVYTHGPSKDKQIQTICTTSPLPPHNKSYLKSIPELRGKSIVGSFHGWVILCSIDDKDSYSLWNPVTLQTLDLPPLPYVPDEQERSACILTSAPDTNLSKGSACLLILFFDGFMSSILPDQENASWNTQKLEFHGALASIEAVTSLNGVVYALAFYSNITISGLQPFTLEVVEDEDSHSLTIRPFEIDNHDLESIYPGNFEHFLESSGRIYRVTLLQFMKHDREFQSVSVRELNLRENTWFDVDCLEGRSFFIGHNCSTWCWGCVNSGERGGIETNSIYFLVPDNDLRILYKYSLQDHSLMRLCLSPNLISPQDKALWVMPVHGRSEGDVELKQIIENDVFSKDVGSVHHKEPQQGNGKESDWLHKLPWHISEEVTKRMHLFDYRNFRATNKMFAKVLPPPRWRTHNSLPLFVFLKNGGEFCEVMDPCRDDSLVLRFFKFSRTPSAIEFSRDGWLLLRVGVGSFNYFNPLTKERGQFPPSEYANSFKGIGFSTNPTFPDCITVAILVAFANELVFLYHRNGDAALKDCVFDIVSQFAPSDSCPLYLEGAFYFVDMRGKLGELKIGDGQDRWRVFDSPWTIDSDLYRRYLVECNGELHSVLIGENGKLQVFKFNRSSEDWTLVDDLGNYILFVSRSSYHSMMTEDDNMRNRIYLPRLKGNGIVFYSLRTGKYHVSNSEMFLEDLYYTRELLQCCWL